METFSALLAICVGNSPVTGEFHAQIWLAEVDKIRQRLHV